MSRRDILKKRQVRLREDIAAMLDSFLIGTVAKSPSMTGHGLTTKVGGKTVTLYVRKDIVPRALEMGKRYKKLWMLVQALSKVNWEILNLENK
jgi:adenosylmethionine-8-amino-7-oxononanoate aminotransferase